MPPGPLKPEINVGVEEAMVPGVIPRVYLLTLLPPQSATYISLPEMARPSGLVKPVMRLELMTAPEFVYSPTAPPKRETNTSPREPCEIKKPAIKAVNNPK